MNLILSNAGRITTICIACFVHAAIGVAAESKNKPLTDFSDPAVAKTWISINDNVMGGVSKGSFQITSNKTLLFSGIIS